MAIGRISGPMLVPNLERQGVDLSIEGNLIYFDVTNKRVGINTSTPETDFQVVGTANITANLFVGETITVGNLYSLPTEKPGYGAILTAEGFDSLRTYWSPAPPELGIRRRKYETTITSLKGYGTAEFVLNLGVSSIVYGLSVSRPVKVEVFGTPQKNEPNPYTFIATPDHLTDDGVVVLNDGSSFQSRQYSIFANFEEPPQPNVYVTLTSLDPYEADTPIKMSVFYFPAVTDSRPGVEVVETLPVTGNYEGKFVYLKDGSGGKLHLWTAGMWKEI